MENLAKAVIAVMKEVKGMEKNSRVGTGNSAYDGTKDKDVKEVFNEVMAKHGLCILPIGVEKTTQIDRWEEVDQWSKETPKATKTKQSVFTEVITKYLLLHESGESQELMGFGQGVDPQDKGAGKSTTYALKNCLLYTFLTPVGKIDDTDTTHSDDIATKPTTKALSKKGHEPAALSKKGHEPAALPKMNDELYGKAIKSTKLESLESAPVKYDLLPKQKEGIEKRITELKK